VVPSMISEMRMAGCLLLFLTRNTSPVRFQHNTTPPFFKKKVI